MSLDLTGATSFELHLDLFQLSGLAGNNVSVSRIVIGDGHGPASGAQEIDVSPAAIGNGIINASPGAEDFIYHLDYGNLTINGFDSAHDRLIIKDAHSVSMSNDGIQTVVALENGSSITLHPAASATVADHVVIA